MLPELFEDETWLMRPSERAAFICVLIELSPEIAIVVGIYLGGSLRRLAARADRVHALDLNPPSEELTSLSNVTFHVGDSHQLLPQLLDELSAQDANVEFVLLDGDHSAAGIKRDVEDLLSSPAISRSVILVHDAANHEVRAGLEAVDYRASPKVTWVDLDWLPGYVSKQGPIAGEAWGGLGLIVVDADHGPSAGPAQIANDAYPIAQLFERVRELEDVNTRLVRSRSWRLTAPLRRLKRQHRR